ncbi:twin-arginine translocase TatA/TatE family subunit [Photobacterium leiognathi]|uniref:twin-arginine translocase TatA/TatE family subunit n=1 Tax=Photobacterium leiognathi TaxID=553611 RepID=UPI003AF3FE99
MYYINLQINVNNIKDHIMGGISLGKLVVIAIVIALLFGTKRLSTIGEDLGNAIKGFRKAINDKEQD